MTDHLVAPRARLASRTLPNLPADVSRPSYDRTAVLPGMVHLGLGAFHRAHQATFVDDCMKSGETEWGIVGASLRSADTRDALAPQDGLYTLSIVDGDGERLRVIGSLLETLVAPDDPGVLLDVMSAPHIRIVTLTVTEKAYLRASTGDLDLNHPDIVWDLANPSKPRTIHGFLAEAIARRRAARSAPFTILSCDNLPSNGATLKRLLVTFAKARNAELGAFVEREIACPSSMVDRIVPATTDEDRARIAERLGVDDAWPVTTEPFLQWVVEDDFPAGRPQWERFGVQMVGDVAPFEEMKLRLLNGSHSSIAYLGLLLGKPTVSDAFSDPLIRRFVARLWAEAIPSLPADAGLNPVAYTAQLEKRYDNPALRHRTAQIANDGSQKLPQRIIAVALERLAAGGSVRHLMLAPAAWLAAALARGRTLPANHFTDPLDAALEAIFARNADALQTVSAAFEAAGFAAGSPHRDTLVRIAADHLDSLRRHGAEATLKELLA
ncbi:MULTISPECIES: mannitol dehydrogenase family protein [unclassified Rhizobium]|uniref:mannitol dehydrogenase family protein n=1 Tax=unclassified Rhizobium TaxID=2613769 RepID=UPI0007139EAD|nr:MULTISPECIES: mannitol dehydrogenase family protein [unclassified Rhizobium]KQS88219.1 mannitol dehydrogenase [Rhizobium sp. Leaf391]KQT00716.1 mannitol dehydrogenase [Rhizobium sp. Leaf386]KQU09189.1 mannitol dehydrogenase [Rhizobium sp. Leaf453]